MSTSEIITMKVWRETLAKLKILAAYRGDTMLRVLDRLVSDELERKEQAVTNDLTGLNPAERRVAAWLTRAWGLEIIYPASVEQKRTPVVTDRGNFVAEELLSTWRRDLKIPVFGVMVKKPFRPPWFKGTEDNPDIIWVNVNPKTRFNLFRKQNIWKTGIDTSLLKQLQGIEQQSGTVMHVFFLQQQAASSETDLQGMPCPKGLYVLHLDQRGDEGMIAGVYVTFWMEPFLTKVAEIEELSI